MMQKELTLSISLLLIVLFSTFENFIYAEGFKNKAKIAILSLYDENYKHIGKFSDNNKQQYAKKHGYDLIIYHESLDSSRPSAWSKIIAIQNHLQDYEWIYWSDADSLIMNTDMKLENFIDENYDLIISKGGVDGNINTGSFLIKNSDWSHDLLREIYAKTQFINHPLWEQWALQHILQQKPNQLLHLKIYEQRVLNANFGYGNSNYWYHDGDFIVHFYGPCTKAKFMEEWCEKIKY